jgi:hypothetical protein
MKADKLNLLSFETKDLAHLCKQDWQPLIKIRNFNNFEGTQSLTFVLPTKIQYIQWHRQAYPLKLMEKNCLQENMPAGKFY